MVDALETRYSPTCLIPNFVSQRETVWAHVWGPKNLGDAGGSAPLDDGVADPLKHATLDMFPYQMSSL